MRKFLRNTYDRINLLRYYSRIFRFRDAVLLLFQRQSRGIITVFSSELRRSIVLRRGTTDLDVVLQVLGAHEYSVTSRIEPRLIIDAGANIGVSTLYFAHRFPDAQIYAIEPEHSNFAILERNCKGLKNIRLYEAALWHCQTYVTLKDQKSENWAFSFTEAAESVPGIPTITIPQLIHESGRETIDILKIDIEGAEKELFSNGCHEWLSRIRLLIIELHDRFVPGCSHAFYSSLCAYQFSQELIGENIIVSLDTRLENLS